MRGSNRLPGISLGDEVMARNNFGTVLGSICGAVFLAAFLATPVRAQDAVVMDLKAKISAAQSVQQNFARGLLHCSELDGKSFYFESRDRVLNLEDYHRALASLALQGSFNPETNRPWNEHDADARWAQVQDQALQGKANCELVASLPDLQRKLQASQQQATATQAPGSK
jgi:hypothetical protein